MFYRVFFGQKRWVRKFKQSMKMSSLIGPNGFLEFFSDRNVE